METDAKAATPEEVVASHTMVAHDPVHAEGERGCAPHRTRGETCLCNLCGTEWPCAIRKEQRREMNACIEHLKDDLYERTMRLDTDPEGVRWTSPIGWSVWLTYGVATLVGTIRQPNGDPWASTTHASVQWLESDLP